MVKAHDACQLVRAQIKTSEGKYSVRFIDSPSTQNCGGCGEKLLHATSELVATACSRIWGRHFVHRLLVSSYVDLYSWCTRRRVG